MRSSRAVGGSSSALPERARSGPSTAFFRARGPSAWSRRSERSWRRGAGGDRSDPPLAWPLEEGVVQGECDGVLSARGRRRGVAVQAERSAIGLVVAELYPTD